MRHFRVPKYSEMPDQIQTYIQRIASYVSGIGYQAKMPVAIDVDLDGQGYLGLEYVLNLGEGVNVESERVADWEIRDSATHSGTLILMPEIIPASIKWTERQAMQEIRFMRTYWGMNDDQTLLNFGSAGLLAGALMALYEMTGEWALQGDKVIRTDAEVEVGREKATLVLGCSSANNGIYCDTVTTDADEFGRVGVMFAAFFPRRKAS